MVASRDTVEIAPGDTVEIAPGDAAEVAYRDIRKGYIYQAYLSSGWNNNAFKYLSMDGLRYSHSIIINYVTDPNNDSIFFLNEDGSLGIALERNFEIEITFYPPDQPGHETFNPFKIVIVNQENEAVHRVDVTKRMKKYKIAR